MEKKDRNRSENNASKLVISNDTQKIVQALAKIHDAERMLDELLDEKATDVMASSFLALESFISDLLSLKIMQNINDSDYKEI